MGIVSIKSEVVVHVRFSTDQAKSLNSLANRLLFFAHNNEKEFSISADDVRVLARFVEDYEVAASNII